MPEPLTKSKDNKELCKEVLLEFVELFDDKIGGPIMDLPCVDALEIQIVNIVVEAVLGMHDQDVDDLFPWSA